MLDFSLTDDEIFRLETLEKIDQYEINNNTIGSIKGNDVLFIMDSNEETWLFTKDKEMFIRNKYNKVINDDDIYNIVPEFKSVSYENQKDFKAINLGLGHALLIRTNIYDKFMSILKSDITYEDEFEPEQIYAAWNHWIDCAIKYIDSSK